MTNVEKELLLNERIAMHENGTCDCDEENMEFCLAGNYLADNLSKKDVFEHWD